MVYEDVKKTISKYNLIQDGDRVIVGVSGGPDSVCLLHTLYKFSKEMNISLYVAHLNHQIRGIDAYTDALYVMNISEKLNIPCFIRSIDVPKYCEERKIGVEEGARTLRYEMFNEIRVKVGANKVAIGHNKNDQAETILMRLMRGTGLQGLRGIEHKRDDGVIRPILDISRDDIEKYCEENKLEPKIDNTNLETIYSRNKIRLEIIPYMEREFNENIIETIVRMSENIKVDSDYIDKQADRSYEISTKRYSDGVYIFTKYMTELHDAIKKRIVIRAIREVLGDAKLIDKKHIDDVLELLPTEKKSKKINLPRGLFAFRFADYILLTNREISFENVQYEYEIQPGRSIYIQELGKTFRTRIVDYDNFDKNNFKNGIQYIDLGKIKDKLILRNRRQGDRIKLLGGTKKIKDLFIGLKIPREDRSFVPLVVSKDSVISVCGHRINIDYKVDENTKKILEFTLE